MNFFRAGTILYLADLVQITIHEMRYDTYHDTLQLNENMNKGLKFIESVYVLPHVQSDFIIFKMNVEQFSLRQIPGVRCPGPGKFAGGHVKIAKLHARRACVNFLSMYNMFTCHFFHRTKVTTCQISVNRNH